MKKTNSDTRVNFLSGAQFLIEPSLDEIRKGYFFPGHRFIPYLPETFLPTNARIEYGENKSLRRKKVRLPMDEVMRQLVLLDRQTGVEYLRENMTSEDFPPVEMVVRVFNCSSFYKSCGFTQGDALLLKIRDRHKGVFSMEYLPRQRKEERRSVSEWTCMFEKTMKQVLTEKTVPLTASHLLTNCFSACGDLMERPPGEIPGILMTNPVFIQWLESSVEQDGELERTDLDLLLEELGLSLSEMTIRSMMMDAHYHHEKRYDPVVERILKGRNRVFESKEQRDDFYKHIEGLWREVSEAYNIFRDQKTGPVRERALIITDELLTFLRSLDARSISYEDLPPDMMNRLYEYSHFTDSFLMLMDEPQDLSEKELAESLENLEKLHQAQADLLGSIEWDSLSAHKDPSAEVYTLRVELEGIKPPIWRRLRLPGESTLGELHFALLAAFDWDGEHLHAFVDRYERVFTDEFAMDEPGDEDEEDWTLEEMFSRKGETLLYIYDFGDNWRHKIKVEKIENRSDYPEEDASRILCLKGRRNAPLDDVGGIWGYQEMVSLGKTPWGDPYDEDAFDLEETNNRLSRVEDE